MFDRQPWMAGVQMMANRMDNRVERRRLLHGGVRLEVTGGDSVMGRTGRGQGVCDVWADRTGTAGMGGAAPAG